MRAETLAQKVAERAADAWYGHHVTSDDSIAVEVVAALALIGKNPLSDRRKLADAVLGVPDEVIATTLALAWSEFWLRRPDLGQHTHPLRAWLDEDKPYDKNLVRAVALTARAAAKAGLFELSDSDHLYDCDLVGAAYMAMKTNKSRQANGEFYTPPELCETMARMTLGRGGLRAGMKIGEPAAGTGGMIRAAAKVIRQDGLSPADMWWFANDISPVSVAGLAVNLHLWDIGPRTVIGVANTLTEPAWQQREWERNRGVFEWRDSLVADARRLAVIRGAEALVAGLEAEQAEESAGPSKVPAGPVVQLSAFDEEEKAS